MPQAQQSNPLYAKANNASAMQRATQTASASALRCSFWGMAFASKLSKRQQLHLRRNNSPRCPQRWAQGCCCTASSECQKMFGGCLARHVGMRRLPSLPVNKYVKSAASAVSFVQGDLLFITCQLMHLPLD